MQECERASFPYFYDNWIEVRDKELIIDSNMDEEEYIFFIILNNGRRRITPNIYHLQK